MESEQDLATITVEQVESYFTDPNFIPFVIVVLGVPIVAGLLFRVYLHFRRQQEQAVLDDAMQLQPDEVDQTPLTSDQRPLSDEPFPDSGEPVSLDESMEAEAAPAPISEMPLEVPEPTGLPEEVQAFREDDHSSWLDRLRKGLSKTRSGFISTLGSMFTGSVKIDDDILENVHETLYKADVGVQTADRLVDALRTHAKKEPEADWPSVQGVLQSEITTIFSQCDKPVNQPEEGPWIILVVGVNGVGKTTTIAKLAASFLAQDKSVLFCAADTYRAAAIDQLKVWGERLGVDVVAKQSGSDPAAVAYDAVKSALARKVDVLLIDTAGRLHNKKELMDELGKINRVVGKDCDGAPHETWLVIDATTGQNAMVQVKAFKEVVNLSGLVVTKLDGTAKGGVIIGAADQFQLPIRYIGVGEKATDLRTFDSKDFAASLFAENPSPA